MHNIKLRQTRTGPSQNRGLHARYSVFSTPCKSTTYKTASNQIKVNPTCGATIRGLGVAQKIGPSAPSADQTEFKLIKPKKEFFFIFLKMPLPIAP
jgi:hypothetical protein